MAGVRAGTAGAYIETGICGERCCDIHGRPRWYETIRCIPALTSDTPQLAAACHTSPGACSAAVTASTDDLCEKTASSATTAGCAMSSAAGCTGVSAGSTCAVRSACSAAPAGAHDEIRR